MTRFGPSASAFITSDLFNLIVLKNVIAIYAIHIHHRKWVKDLRIRIDLGNTSTDGKILPPAVVKPDIDSNSPSTNLLHNEKDSTALGSGNHARRNTIAEIQHAIIQARNTICTPLARLVHETISFGLMAYHRAAHPNDKEKPTHKIHGCSTGNLGSA
jgi:hypothetical protein